MESEGKTAHQPFDRRSGKSKEFADADTSFEEQYVNENKRCGFRTSSAE